LNLRNKKELVARMLGVGVSRVWIHPDYLDVVSDAVTADDIRKLIKEKIIRIKPKKGVCRYRARLRLMKKKRGRLRGHGSRKGKKSARLDPKRQWIIRVRAQRRYLRMLRDKGLLEPSTYQKLRRMVKGGAFRSLRHLKSYIKENSLLKEEVISLG